MTTTAKRRQNRRAWAGGHLIVRRDGVLCTVCFEVEPIHCGDGTPLPSMLAALKGSARRHPPTKHQRLTP